MKRGDESESEGRVREWVSGTMLCVIACSMQLASHLFLSTGVEEDRARVLVQHLQRGVHL